MHYGKDKEKKSAPEAKDLPPPPPWKKKKAK